MMCETAVDLIIDSLMSPRDEGPDEDLSAHLRSCPSCAAEAERIRRIWQDLGKLSAPDATPRAAVEFGRRLHASRRGSRIRPLLRAAAAIALLSLGAAAGYAARGGGSDGVTASVSGQLEFLLLVRGGPQGPVEAAGVVLEYQQWALALASEGRLVGGNKLMDEPGRWLSAPRAEDPRTSSDISGYFLVSASDYEEAIEIARTSPHIGYGGTFEIRQVDPVN
jgi:hypothetical protein